MTCGANFRDTTLRLPSRNAWTQNAAVCYDTKVKSYKQLAGSDGGSGIVAQVQGQAQRVQNRLADIKHTVAVMSGKGGVGKTAVAVNLAASLAQAGYAVGVLDADINGPSVAKMLGVRDASIKLGADSLQPARSQLGIAVMSMDLLLPSEDAPVVWNAPTQQDAFTWRGIMEVTALREMLSDTEWGSLDYLLIDLPPGPERMQNLASVLPTLGGSIVVTIPSQVSRLVVKKAVRVTQDTLSTPIVGLVCNMAYYLCPSCGDREPLFSDASGEDVAADIGVPLLGEVPFDPRLAAASDDGMPLVTVAPDAPATQAFHQMAQALEQFWSRDS
jgi:ATP-binding protein involved in chromosome partitioning